MIGEWFDWRDDTPPSCDDQFYCIVCHKWHDTSDLSKWIDEADGEGICDDCYDEWMLDHYDNEEEDNDEDELALRESE